MTIFTLSRLSPLASEAIQPSFTSRAARRIYVILSFPFAFYRARREIALLAGMDDHQLCDIGLTRMDVANAASLPVSRSPTEALAEWVEERRRSRFARVRSKR